MRDHRFVTSERHCEKTGKVMLTGYAADKICAQNTTMARYRCGDHWHVGHPPKKES